MNLTVTSSNKNYVSIKYGTYTVKVGSGRYECIIDENVPNELRIYDKFRNLSYAINISVDTINVNGVTSFATTEALAVALAEAFYFKEK